MKEDAMSTSSVALKPRPLLKKPKDGKEGEYCLTKSEKKPKGALPQYPTQGPTWKMFQVCAETFNKFETGRFKFERWAKYLNLGVETEKAVYDYATANRKKIVVLQCSDTGALRTIRRIDKI